MDNKMIERCAKASGVMDTLGFERIKAIIRAMREPTEKMLEPVTNADGFFKVSDPIQAWQKMIDAIIGEE